MTNFEKSQSQKILASYGFDLDLIKGGKPAYIGEVREYNGIKKVKHQDGWIYLKKDGTHHIELQNKTHQPASKEYIEHFNEHIKAKEVNLSQTKPLTKIKVRRTLAANHATLELSNKYKSLTKHLLEVSKPIVNELIQNITEKFKKEGKEFKNDERQLYKINTTYEVLSEITKYCEENDKIVDSNVYGDKDRVIVDLLIERDGKEYNLSTQVINAAGYNIQRLHTRYITDSKLPKTKTPIDLDKLNDNEIYQLTSNYKALDKINKLNKVISRAHSMIEDGKHFEEEFEKYPKTNKEFVDKVLELPLDKMKELKILVGIELESYDYTRGFNYGSYRLDDKRVDDSYIKRAAVKLNYNGPTENVFSSNTTKEQQESYRDILSLAAKIKKDDKHLTIVDIVKKVKDGEQLYPPFDKDSPHTKNRQNIKYSEMYGNENGEVFKDLLKDYIKHNFRECKDSIATAQKKLKQVKLESSLPVEYPEPIDVKYMDWDSKTNTLSFEKNRKKPEFHEAKVLLDGTNVENKTFTVFNPKSQRSEIFKYKDLEKEPYIIKSKYSFEKDSTKYKYNWVFESKQGIKMVINSSGYNQ